MATSSLAAFGGGLARPEPLADQVAGEIRGAIVSGKIAPGTHLSVPELARQLGVSRTPAREALLILEREGLVGRRGSAGMQVLIGDASALADMLEIREVLEGLAARRAAERVTPADRQALLDLHERHLRALQRDDIAEHAQLDADFHALIRRIAASASLDEQLERIERVAQVLNRALSDEEGFDPHLVDIDHQAIMHAIIARAPEDAEAAARAHIRRMSRFLRTRRGQNDGADTGATG